MVNRLKVVCPSLISKEQEAFVSGQNIAESIMLAQEIMHSLVKAPAIYSLMTLKLDMEKVYDQVQWSYLLHVLQDFGFHAKFISWIMATVCHPQFTGLVNGILTSWFQPNCRLR